MSEGVNRYIEQNKESILAELQECLQQPSFAANNEGMQEGIELTRKILERRGMETELLPTSGHPGILGVLKGESSKTLLFYQHYDVLPPGDLSQWDSDPFAAEIRDGKIFARGAADHKGSFMSRIHAVDALLSAGPLPVTVKFLLEGEEELGSPHLPEIVDRYRDRLQADAALYSGWWKDEADRPRINCGMRGGFRIKLTARGANRGLHEHQAALIPNAAWRLVWALNTLKDPNERILIDGFYDDVDEITPEDEEALHRIPFNGDIIKQRLGVKAFVSNVEGIEAVKRQVFSPTLTIRPDVQVGDGSSSDLPCIAQAVISIRLVPSQQPGDIVEKLKRHLERHGFDDIEVELASPLRAPARISLNEPIVQVAREAANEVYGRDPIVVPLSSGSGPRDVFVNQLGVPMVADTGVGHNEQRDHGFNENIRIRDYLDGIRVIAGIIQRFRDVDLR